MGNLYQIRKQSVISSILGDLPTDAAVSLPVSCIIFGLGGTFYINTEKGKSEEGHCFFIASDVTYKVMPLTCNGYVILFFDAVSPEHYFLHSTYGASNILKLEWRGDEAILQKTFSKLNEAESDAFLDTVFQTLFNVERKNISHEFDNRITQVDEYIRKNIREKFTNRELAEHIHLSESRFYHFFKEQTGVNVSRYVLWLRLKTIFERYFKSEFKLNALIDITNFTDLSHFIKSFKSFFGETPKRLLNK
ncbi:MAG: helix-turn-helix transcriptional regulator [Bacteroidia bacterium]|nr:helix-turn-helix transcriptional regulator [Bacteroidia bacterium]